MDLEHIKQRVEGEWKSLTIELRPSQSKDADGNIQPFYLTRIFRYAADDTFALEISNFADTYGNLPLVRIQLKGHAIWQGDHAIATGAQNVYFIADTTYGIPPMQ